MSRLVCQLGFTASFSTFGASVFSAFIDQLSAPWLDVIPCWGSGVSGQFPLPSVVFQVCSAHQVHICTLCSVLLGCLTCSFHQREVGHWSVLFPWSAVLVCRRQVGFGIVTSWLALSACFAVACQSVWPIRLGVCVSLPLVLLVFHQGVCFSLRSHTFVPCGHRPCQDHLFRPLCFLFGPLFWPLFFSLFSPFSFRAIL